MLDIKPVLVKVLRRSHSPRMGTLFQRHTRQIRWRAPCSLRAGRTMRYVSE